MNSENLRVALLKSKDIALGFLGRVLSSTRVEPIRDAEGDLEGIKASWVGEQGASSLKMNAPTWNADIEMEGTTAPTVEYVQHGDTRSVAVRNIKNLSCEVDRQTLDRLATPKGAGIAMCAGAAAGLLGWFVISVMRSLSVPSKEQKGAQVPPIATEDVGAETETPAAEL